MSESIKLEPEALEKFAKSLKSFSSELGQSCSRLRGEAKQLGTQWSDPAHRRWEESFNQALKAIQQFQKASEEHYPFLMRKARAAKAARDVR